MFFHEAIRVCTAQATNYGNQYASPAIIIIIIIIIIILRFKHI